MSAVVKRPKPGAFIGCSGVSQRVLLADGADLIGQTSRTEQAG